MKVPFVCGPGDLRLLDVERPTAGPRDVVVRIAAAGICGSDVGYVAIGGLTGRPMPLGHELAGTVETVGAAVSGVRAGDRVIVNPMHHDIGNGGPEGGFAERLLVRDVADAPGALLPIPDHVPFERAVLAEPLAVGAHGVNRVGAQPGDTAAVFGAGPIGLAAIINLRRRGVRDIVAIDLSAERRARAIALGAALAVDPRAEEVADVLARLHGTVTLRGTPLVATDRFIEASGAPVMGDILAMAAPGTTVCVVSIQKQPGTIDWLGFMARELTVTSSCGYGAELANMLALLADDAVDLDAFVSHSFAGEDFLAAFATAGDPARSAKVLVRY